MPKGFPSYKGDKKLAVLVEDHPVEYLNFKGTIPKGEYGAGTVEIWDTGTYEPIGDFDKGLKTGHITCLLKGGKINGSFTLARFRNEKYWLLLVHNEQDFMTDLREFGKSSPMIHAVEPMKSVLIEKPFDSDEWLFEIKWDGIRAVSYIDQANLSILSRNQKEQNYRYPELTDLTNSILGTQAVIDGEIVVLDENGISRFELLQQRMGLQNKPEIQNWEKRMPVVYYVFDLLFLDGRDLREELLSLRRSVLEKVIMPFKNIRLSDEINAKGVSFYEAVKEKGLEGIMAKKKSSKYVYKRSADWKKIKIVMEQEAVIGGFTEKRGTRPYFGALLLGVYEDGRFVYIGHTGTGFSTKTLEELYGKMSELKIPESPFTDPPKPNEKAHWVKPELIANIKFSEWTKAGKMRQPVFLGLRFDKKPEEVIREIPKEAA